MVLRLLTVLLAAVPLGCQSPTPQLRPAPAAEAPEGAEAVSLLGQPLYRPVLEPAEQEKRDQAVQAAHELWKQHPNDAGAFIAYARSVAYAGEFARSVELFSEGIGRWPSNARLWRHRGHRYITLRLFELAERDLEQAAALAAKIFDEPEPPMAPNPQGIVIDSLKQNIYYHLGLARYLQENYSGAQEAFRQCLSFSNNNDARCSASYWLAMTLRRMGQDGQAKAVVDAIPSNMEVVEYKAYFGLCRMFKGELDPEWLAETAEETGPVDAATVNYGVGVYQLLSGKTDLALEHFNKAAHSPMWPAFGCIASEVELRSLAP